MSNNPILTANLEISDRQPPAAQPGEFAILLDSPAYGAQGKVARKKYFTIHETFDMFIALSESNISGRVDFLEDCTKEIP